VLGHGLPDRCRSRLLALLAIAAAWASRSGAFVNSSRKPTRNSGRLFASPQLPEDDWQRNADSLMEEAERADEVRDRRRSERQEESDKRQVRMAAKYKAQLRKGEDPVARSPRSERRPEYSEEELKWKVKAKLRADWAEAQELEDRRRQEAQDAELTPEHLELREENERRAAELEKRRLSEEWEARRARMIERDEVNDKAKKAKVIRMIQAADVKQERYRTRKQQIRCERVADLSGAKLPTAEEAKKMSISELRKALWTMGFSARGLPSPVEARTMDRDELRKRLSACKAAFLKSILQVVGDHEAVQMEALEEEKRVLTPREVMAKHLSSMVTPGVNLMEGRPAEPQSK